MCVCVCATIQGTQGVGSELALPEAAASTVPSPGYTGPEGDTGGPPPAAWGGPSGNTQKHKGPPTASPSHPPRGHQGTHKKGDNTKPPQTHWVIAGRQVNRGRRRDCTWRSAACREFTTRMREGMFAHPLRGGRPPSRPPTDPRTPGAFGGKGGRGRLPPSIHGRAQTHPPTRRGGTA